MTDQDISLTRHVAGVVLASGMSSRFGDSNKLLAPWAGTTVIARTVQAYLGAGLEPVMVVVGYQAEQVRAALQDTAVTIVVNPDFEEGQSRALVRGVEALPITSEAAVIGVGDQPLLESELVRRLVARYRDTDGLLVIPRYAGRRGNPVLFNRALFSELAAVTGDQGGRAVIERHGQGAIWVDWHDEIVGADLDTIEEYHVLRSVDRG